MKAAIIRRLVECERDETLYPDLDEWQPDGRKRDWCTYLFNEFLRTPNKADFRSNQLKVITFNFDRSFERKLFRLIKAAYGVGDDEAMRLRFAINVLHVHGRLGGEYWVGERRQESRPFEPTCSVEQQAVLFDQIRIIHEEVEQEVLDKAHEWLKAAHTICFLGFGFHPINVQRLRMHEPHDGATIVGTAFGLSDPELARAKRRFKHPPSDLFFDRERDAYTLDASQQEALYFSILQQPRTLRVGGFPAVVSVPRCLCRVARREVAGRKVAYWTSRPFEASVGRSHRSGATPYGPRRRRGRALAD